MVGAGVYVFLHPTLHSRFVTDSKDRIDQPVASPVGEVGVAEPQSLEVASVVRPRQEPGEVLPSGSSGFGLRAEDNTLFDGEQFVWPECLTRRVRVFSRGQKRMCAIGKPCCNLEHAWTKGGDEHRRSPLWSVAIELGGVHRLQVVTHGVHRSAVVVPPGRGGALVADTDSEEEPLGMSVAERSPGIHHGRRVAGPDDGDTGGNRDRRRRSEEHAGEGQDVLPERRFGNPHRAISQLFELVDDLDRLSGGSALQPAAPHPDSTQWWYGQWWCGQWRAGRGQVRLSHR